MHLPRVHLITDRHLTTDLVLAARRALTGLRPATVAVHLREKDLGGRALLALAHELLSVCRELGQILIVNDRLDVAVAVGADGVHLPSAGVTPAEARKWVGANTLIGVSCHGEVDVARAAAGNADFATFGPLFDTPSKRVYGPPVGLAAMARAAALGLPLVGLGGVTPADCPALKAAGAWGAAAIRAWLCSADPAAAVERMVAALTGPDARP